MSNGGLKQSACGPAAPCGSSGQKARQTEKIREIARAVEQAGLSKLDQQAKALGLERSTAWTILQGNHKGSGISAKTINRMLTSADLPRSVRVALLEYIEERAAGHYGHGKTECRKFRAKIRDYSFGQTANGLTRNSPKR
jgi:hypothetical protein